MWQVVNCKNGISSYEVHRAIGVTQKTAWFMDHRIRFALGMQHADKLTGEVEVDETSLAEGAEHAREQARAAHHGNGRAKDKTAVMGLLERGREGPHHGYSKLQEIRPASGSEKARRGRSRALH